MNNLEQADLLIVQHDTVMLQASALYPHPLNRPATGVSREHVDTLKAMIQQSGYNASKPLTVRQWEAGHQIIEGHHRWHAATELGYTELPCVIEDLDDSEASLRLLTGNQQTGNDPLDIGLTALATVVKSNGGRGVKSEMSVSAFAERIGKSQQAISETMIAARVHQKLTARAVGFDPTGRFKIMAEIGGAPEWLWCALGQAAMDGKWTKETARQMVGNYKQAPEPPKWCDQDKVALALLTGKLSIAELTRMYEYPDRARVTDVDLKAGMYAQLNDQRPSAMSDVQVIVNHWIAMQEQRLAKQRQAEAESQRATEAAKQRVERLRKNCSLDEWKSLSPDEQQLLLVPVPGAGGSFNAQKNEAIEWAQWSWNPVTGCKHDCPYCLSGDTLILMADGHTKPLREIVVGDRIIGTVADNGYQRFTETEVLAHWQTHKQAFEITLADGRTIISSGDHRFLTERGWKFAQPADIGQRPYLTTNNSMLGIGASVETPAITDEYKRGYLCGIVRGDGHLKTHKDYRRINSYMHQFRLAMIDEVATERAASYLDSFGVPVNWFDFTITNSADGSQKVVRAIRTNTADAFHKICAITEITDDQSVEYLRGFVAGIFDAEGTNNGNNNISVLRIFNSDEAILYLIEKALTFSGEFKWIYDTDKQSANKVVRTIRIKGGLAEHVRFFQWCDPAIRRKLKIAGASIKNDLDLQVASIRPMGVEIDMFDITTGTEDFIANGIVAHNCYARDIALGARMQQASLYPNGWEPTLRSNSLGTPESMRVPAQAQTDTRYRNVFTCSMADLFGRWVPASWIDAVMATVRDSPEWNFLFLTKFPQRLAECEIPDNAWMGTTVDLQARVASAEKAFAKMGGKIKWLSVEPMLEPLHFDHLELFDWVVIGGSSKSEQTPEWHPPYRWIESLVRQCDDAKVPVYMKTNLGIANRLLQLPFNAPLVQPAQIAPEVFHYLGKKSEKES